jgi:hypothetical protein
MPTLPQPVSDYLESLSIKDRFPAFLLASPEGELKRSGGDLAHYGLEDLTVRKSSR